MHGGISAIPLGVAVGATVGVAAGGVVGVAVGAVVVVAVGGGAGVPEERGDAGVAVGGSVLAGGVSHAASMSVSDAMRAAMVMMRVITDLHRPGEPGLVRIRESGRRSAKGSCPCLLFRDG